MSSEVSSTFSAKSEPRMVESQASQHGEGKTQGSHPGHSQQSSSEELDMCRVSGRAWGAAQGLPRTC